MGSIDDLISELAGIRNALGQEGGEPWRRPRRRGPTGAPTSERVSGDPIFDAGRWEITDRDLCEEEKESARRAELPGHDEAREVVQHREETIPNPNL
jgi:hypothetical protein